MPGSGVDRQVSVLHSPHWTISMHLYRKYAPQSWSEVIGHKHVKTAVSLMKSRGSLGGKAFMITGPSGIGKSTCARLIALDVCDEDNIIDLDASGLTPAGVVELERSLRTLATGRSQAVPSRSTSAMRSARTPSDSCSSLSSESPHIVAGC